MLISFNDRILINTDLQCLSTRRIARDDLPLLFEFKLFSLFDQLAGLHEVQSLSPADISAAESESIVEYATVRFFRD
jgi:hypothetical protein